MKYRILCTVLILITLLWIFIYSTRKEVLPLISYTTIKNQTYHLKDLKNQVILIQFWATSCASCIQEMPQLVKIHNKFIKESVKIIGVAMYYDVPSFVINYTQTNQIPFDIVIDKEGEFAKAFGEIGIVPTLFAVNERRQIIKKWVGVPDLKELDQFIIKTLENS